MTTEYSPGSEDIALEVNPDPNGYVRVAVRHYPSGEKVLGFALPAEAARSFAFKLTTSSIKAEDMLAERQKWREEQENEE